MTALYALIQALYWSAYCLMFNYATSFLQDRGYTAAVTGLILAVCNTLSALSQPLFADVISRRRLNPAKSIRSVYFFVVASACALMMGSGKVLQAILFSLMLTLENAMLSPVVSLAHAMELSGNKVNFSLARGIGSFGFSITALFTGSILKRYSTSILPYLYCGVSIVMMIALHLAQHRCNCLTNTTEKARMPISEVFRYRPFALFIAGVVSIMIAHMFMDSFMLRLMQNVGGGNAEIGVAFAIASAMEVPSALLYGRMRKHFSCAKLLAMAGCVWTIKHLLTIIAPSPQAIYLCQTLQFFTFAIYSTAGVEFVGIVLPEELYAQGQAFVCTAFVMGCVPATLLGGTLLDIIGLRPTLYILEGFMVVGAILFILAAAFQRRASAERKENCKHMEPS